MLPKPTSPKLAELRDKLREAKNNYWAGQVDIQWQVATAWTLYAEGKYDEALKAMSAAADAEDKSEKSPVTPGPLAPARELYGFMLLDRGMAREALTAFEGTMAKEPNRFNAYVGERRPRKYSATRQRRKPNTKSWSRSRPAVRPNGQHSPTPGHSSRATRSESVNRSRPATQ